MSSQVVVRGNRQPRGRAVGIAATFRRNEELLQRRVAAAGVEVDAIDHAAEGITPDRRFGGAADQPGSA